jgi:hypothetical protein
VLFPINPTLLAEYREAFKPSRAKDDPTDAQLALDLMQCHPHQSTPLKPQSVPMRTLSLIVEQRRLLVDDKKRLVNRLGNTLKQYSPQVLAWSSFSTCPSLHFSTCPTRYFGNACTKRFAFSNFF